MSDTSGTDINIAAETRIGSTRCKHPVSEAPGVKAPGVRHLWHQHKAPGVKHPVSDTSGTDINIAAETRIDSDKIAVLDKQGHGLTLRGNG